MTDEEYVRAHWEWSHYLIRLRCVVISDGNQTTDPTTRFDGPPDEAWAAAAEFTRERLEQIRQLQEEKYLLGMIALLASEPGDLTAPIYKRTVARLEAALADLRKGMKA